MPGHATAATRAAARTLRRAQTKPERLLWWCLRDHRGGAHFRRQHGIGPYVLDFYCAEARLCVEVDGGSHDLTHAHDATRDAFLKRRHGIATLRFEAREVLTNLDGVARQIAEIVRQRTAPTAADAACSP